MKIEIDIDKFKEHFQELLWANFGVTKKLGVKEIHNVVDLSLVSMAVN